MFCSNCGKTISDTAKFCDACGAPNEYRTAPAPDAHAQQNASVKDNKSGHSAGAQRILPEGKWISPNIALCSDGKYRWVYEVSLFKNPSIFLLIWKIFFFIVLGIFAFMLVIDVVNGDLDGERALDTLKFFGIFLGGMTALVGISYLIYAAVMGGKYVVIFEMDDEGVNHKQLPKQAKKAEAIGLLAAFMGAATHSPSTALAGLGATRTEMYTQFSIVRKVKAYPRRGLIKVSGLIEHNQVYAAPEDFDFVLGFIRTHVPERK